MPHQTLMLCRLTAAVASISSTWRPRSVLIVLSCPLIFASCLRLYSPPKLEARAAITITTEQYYRLKNSAIVHVEPGGREVNVDWKGFNVRTGSAFNVPFEELTLSSGNETYLISSEGTGYQLLLDGKLIKFDRLTQLVGIRFGSGASVETLDKSKPVVWLSDAMSVWK